MKKRKVIGVCLTRIYLEHQTDTIKSLCKSASGKNIKLLIFSPLVYLNRNPNHPERKMFNAINFGVLDGLIIVPDYIRNDDVTNELAAKAQSHNIPVLIMDGHADGCYSVNFDFTTSFEQVVRHIIEFHGCKKVNFIAAYEGNPYSEARLDCYKKVLAENNLPFEQDRVYYGDFEEEYTYTLIDEMAAKGELPEAVICANDEMAIGACNGFFQKGITSPKDIFITGFDGVLQEKYNTPRLTTCFLDSDEVTEKIISIFESIFNGEKPEKENIIGYKMRIGQSCGCEPLIITDANYSANTNNRFRKLKTDFSERMFASSNKISSSRYYEEFFQEIESEMELIKCKTLRCCLLDGFILMEFAESALFDKNEQNLFDTTTMMNMVFGWKDGTRLESCLFNRNELLPNINDILESEEESHLFFFPACHNKQYIGFVSMEFDIDAVDFGNIFNYMTIFSSNIGFVKSNYDMYMAVTMLKYMYMHDTMTDLFNRRGFYSEINRLMQDSKNPNMYLILFSIDLDGMKIVNDNFGHHEGDNTIRTTAQLMLSASVDMTAINARFGGDEFITAVLTDKPEQAAESFTGKLKKSLDGYNKDSGKPYEIQLSIGHAYELIEELGKNIDSLIKKADISMYNDKKCKKTHRTSKRIE